MSKEVEIYTTASGRSLARDNLVMVRIGSEVATMTGAEWSKLISQPRYMSEGDYRWREGEK